MASEKAGRALEEFARKDTDVEIQEQAVFALSQLEDNQGVEPLIKLAKTHPDPRIRKKAVFWLGECDDPRALETLIAIIKGK
jgi:HEAT repeat protein